MASRRGYTAYNKSVLMKGLTVHVKNVITPDLVNVLKRVVDSLVNFIDSGYIPEYLSHLHDSTGSAVYADGALVYFRPTNKHASGKKGKSGFGGVNHYEIDGAEFLQRTINDASSTFAKGVWFVVMATVPYAYHINANGSPKGRGKDFFKSTYEEAIKEILAGLRPIDPSVSTSIGTTL